MANPFKTQKVPFHIHTSHDNVSTGADRSTIDIPLDPPLVLPKGARATVQMYNFAGTNSAVNVSPQLSNSEFFVTDAKHPDLVTKLANSLIIDFAGTEFNPIPAKQTFLSATANVGKGQTLAQTVASLNSVMGSLAVLSMKVDHVDGGFALFARSAKGAIRMNRETLSDISVSIRRGSLDSVTSQVSTPYLNSGTVIIDASNDDWVQISDAKTSFDQFTFKTGATPVSTSLPKGIYAVKGTSALPDAVSDLEAEMERAIANITGNMYSSGYDGQSAGSDETYNSINITSDGVHFKITLRLSNDPYTITIPPGLARFLGVAPATYPPLGESLTTDYVIPRLTGATPRTDDFATLQLRSGISQALGGEGKPAAIISQFNVPAGTAIGSNFEVVPPTPMEVPCTLPSPVSTIRFQLTNMRGDAADMQGNHWSASLLLTISET